MPEVLEDWTQAKGRHHSNAPHPARNAKPARASATLPFLGENAMSECTPSSNARCDCPSGSYWIKHTAGCYERRIECLQRENTALRNLAENLRPGPISEALAGAADEPAANHSKGFVYTGELHIVGHGGIIYGRWVRAEDVGAQPPAGCAECGVTKDQHDNPDEFVPRAAPLPKACALPNCTVLCRHAHDVDGPWVLPAVPPDESLSLLQAVYREMDNYSSVSEETLQAVELYLRRNLGRLPLTKPASDRFPDATPAHTCVDGINRVGTPEGCSVCSGETAPYLGKQIEQAQQQLAETPAYVKGPDETRAAHGGPIMTLRECMDAESPPACEYSDSGAHECKHCDQEWKG